MSDTYTQPTVSFIHPDIANKLESIRSLLEGEYASAAQSPDHAAGPWSPEKVGHVETIGKAIEQIDGALRSLLEADHRAMARMTAAKTNTPADTLSTNP